MQIEPYLCLTQNWNFLIFGAPLDPKFSKSSKPLKKRMFKLANLIFLNQQPGKPLNRFFHTFGGVRFEHLTVKKSATMQ